MISPINVVHSCPVWLTQTQTWMYNQLHQLQQLDEIEAHVACDRTENLNQFPINNIHSLENEPSYRQIWDKGLRAFQLQQHSNLLVSIGEHIDTQIIHSHFGNVGWANLAAARKLRAKHVVTFYGLDVNKLPTQKNIWLKRYKQMFSEVDRVLCEGSHMANCVIDLGCPAEKVKVQHLGIDVDRILFKPRQWKLGKPLRVLIAASFREKKGIPYAIEALGTIAKTIQIELTIIGDAGPKSEEQREKARILAALTNTGLKEHTRLLGYQTHKAMLQEAYEHHMFIQPSVTAADGDTEGGAPVTILEMLATGMPVVATTHCDIPEVVGPTLLDFLAPERDAKGLSDCIYSLLNKSRDWNHLLTDARRHIEVNYHWTRQAEALTQHYTEVL